MTTIPEKIMERLHKLKTMRDRGTEGEAKAAAALLQRLLLEHNLTMNDVDCSDSNGNDPSTVMSNLKLTGEFYWKLILINGLCAGHLCKFVIMDEKTKQGVVIGDAHNVAVVMEMFTYLEQIVLRLSKEGLEAALKDRPNMPKELNGWTYRNSYMKGCAVRLGQRLIDNLAKAQSELNNCTALVLNSQTKIKRKLEQEGIRLGERVPSKRDMTVVTDAYEQGLRAGEKISLNKQLHGAAHDVLPGNERKSLKNS